MRPPLAVALHDVEPRTLDRVSHIRAWLAQRGASRITLLVIPAPDYRPISEDRRLLGWLQGQVAAGDIVAQHGFTHRAGARPPWPRAALAAWQGGHAAEFPGLSREVVDFRLTEGRRLLSSAGIEPRGFVAPGYAYTATLRVELATRFEWTADLRSVRTAARGDIRAPALCLGTSTAFKRAASPALIRALAARPGPVLRVDVHPADFAHRRHLATLEWLLGRADERQVVTYDDLLG